MSGLGTPWHLSRDLPREPLLHQPHLVGPARLRIQGYRLSFRFCRRAIHSCSSGRDPTPLGLGAVEKLGSFSHSASHADFCRFHATGEHLVAQLYRTFDLREPRARPTEDVPACSSDREHAKGQRAD